MKLSETNMLEINISYKLGDQTNTRLYRFENTENAFYVDWNEKVGVGIMDLARFIREIQDKPL